MGTGNHAEPGLLSGAAQTELGDQWRRLIRSATFIAVLTSPAAFIWFHEAQGWSVPWSIVGAFLVVIAFRGAVDLIVRRLIPWPSLYAVGDSQLKEEDVVNRRRVWFWWYWFRVLRFFVVVITIIWLFQLARGKDATWWGTATAIPGAFDDPAIWQNLFILPLFFLINFLILFGPLMLVGVTQMRGFEPGDADWGVRLEDVRGQDEAKEEVNRVVSLWQSGEAFERAGGKRERGLLFLGPPGTGKTMLSKAIATSFNCPFVSMPGSGFAQTFLGMDVVIVRYLAYKARKLARKWGGQCIIFIDEIDAVGRRRQALTGGEGGGFATPRAGVDRFEEHAFYGPW